MPIASKNPQQVYPFEVFLPKGAAGLPKDFKVDAAKIRTLAGRRLIKYIGALDQKDLDAIENAIKIRLLLGWLSPVVIK